MDESIWVLENAVENARIGGKARLMALRRLRRYVP